MVSPFDVRVIERCCVVLITCLVFGGELDRELSPKTLPDEMAER